MLGFTLYWLIFVSCQAQQSLELIQEEILKEAGQSNLIQNSSLTTEVVRRRQPKFLIIHHIQFQLMWPLLKSIIKAIMVRDVGQPLFNHGVKNNSIKIRFWFFWGGIGDILFLRTISKFAAFVFLRKRWSTRRRWLQGWTRQCRNYRNYYKLSTDNLPRDKRGWGLFSWGR